MSKKDLQVTGTDIDAMSEMLDIDIEKQAIATPKEDITSSKDFKPLIDEEYEEMKSEDIARSSSIEEPLFPELPDEEIPDLDVPELPEENIDTSYEKDEGSYPEGERKGSQSDFDVEIIGSKLHKDGMEDITSINPELEKSPTEIEVKDIDTLKVLDSELRKDNSEEDEKKILNQINGITTGLSEKHSDFDWNDYFKSEGMFIGLGQKDEVTEAPSIDDLLSQLGDDDIDESQLESFDPNAAIEQLGESLGEDEAVTDYDPAETLKELEKQKAAEDAIFEQAENLQSKLINIDNQRRSMEPLRSDKEISRQTLKVASWEQELKEELTELISENTGIFSEEAIEWALKHSAKWYICNECKKPHETSYVCKAAKVKIYKDTKLKTAKAVLDATLREIKNTSRQIRLMKGKASNQEIIAKIKEQEINLIKLNKEGEKLVQAGGKIPANAKRIANDAGKIISLIEAKKLEIAKQSKLDEEAKELEIKLMGYKQYMAAKGKKEAHEVMLKDGSFIGKMKSFISTFSAERNLGSFDKRDEAEQRDIIDIVNLYMEILTEMKDSGTSSGLSGRKGLGSRRSRRTGA